MGGELGVVLGMCVFTRCRITFLWDFAWEEDRISLDRVTMPGSHVDNLLVHHEVREARHQSGEALKSNANLKDVLNENSR